MAGDYDRFSRYMEQDARVFYERLDVPAGCELLDVGCGSGQLALLAVRNGVKVTGVDIAPNLVQRAQARAKAEGLNARFMEGDAEALPFDEASFDVVTSLVGAMFAPRPELVASELLRVCNREARLPWSTGRRRVLSARCSRRFKVHCAPPRDGRGGCGAGKARLWNQRSHDDPAHVYLYLSIQPCRGGGVPSAGAFVSFDENAATKLRAELEALWSPQNLRGDELTVVQAEYLEVIALRK